MADDDQKTEVTQPAVKVTQPKVQVPQPKVQTPASVEPVVESTPVVEAPPARRNVPDIPKVEFDPTTRQWVPVDKTEPVES